MAQSKFGGAGHNGAPRDCSKRSNDAASG